MAYDLYNSGYHVKVKYKSDLRNVIINFKIKNIFVKEGKGGRKGLIDIKEKITKKVVY